MHIDLTNNKQNYQKYFYFSVRMQEYCFRDSQPQLLNISNNINNRNTRVNLNKSIKTK